MEYIQKTAKKLNIQLEIIENNAILKAEILIGA